MGDSWQYFLEVTTITTKYDNNTKVGASGEVLRLKAKVDARGNQQLEGVDFFDIFVLVIKWPWYKQYFP